MLTGKTFFDELKGLDLPPKLVSAIVRLGEEIYEIHKQQNECAEAINMMGQTMADFINHTSTGLGMMAKKVGLVDKALKEEK